VHVFELHAPLKVIQRSKGQSAVAAAAYRSASRLIDERTGQIKDFTSKQGVLHNALLLPDNAPEWAHDRQLLWNAAEMRERHVKAQTARELVIAFPKEMSEEQRTRTGYETAQILVERYGAAVDITFHEPSREGNQANYHAHLLFSVRRFDEFRPDGWAKTKDRLLDDRSKEKGAEHSNGALEVLWLRERVAGVMNDIAAANKLDVYVEHLSFEKRGLDRQATQHLGPHASDIQRKYEAAQAMQQRTGKKHDLEPSDIALRNERIREENARRERLEAEKNVIDLAAERQRRAEAKEAADLLRDKELRETKQQQRHGWYTQVQRERTALLREQQEEFGAQENAVRAELMQLHQSTERVGWFGFVRFWHRVTGRREAELQRIEALQADYDRIQAAKAVQSAEFEQRRVAQLERIKTREIEREAERAELVNSPVQSHAANERSASAAPSFSEPGNVSQNIHIREQQRKSAQERLSALHSDREARMQSRRSKPPTRPQEASKEPQAAMDLERDKAEARAMLRRREDDQQRERRELGQSGRDYDDGPELDL